LESLGHAVLWWEMPHRRPPDDDETGVELPGGFRAPEGLVRLVQGELERVRSALEACAGSRLGESQLRQGVQRANQVRRRLAALRHRVFTAPLCPLPALEELLAEMLAIHFCSDQEESLRVLDALLAETQRRVDRRIGVLAEDAARIFWVNPVADLRAMNLLEDAGGRICGTEYLFSHALDEIPENVSPLEALARMALADPMVGSPLDRAERICADIVRYGAEAVIVSWIPGASHCALEGITIGKVIRQRLGIPVLEIEVTSIADATEPALRTRLEALVETTRQRRQSHDMRRY